MTRETTETTDEQMTPADVLDRYFGEEGIEKFGGEPIFAQAFTPKTRALILDVLVSERGGALSAQMIADHHDDLSVSGVNRHRDALRDLGLIEEAGKVGNAMTYALNTRHPAAQVLAMLDNIFMWGETPMILDEQFASGDAHPTAVDEWSAANPHESPKPCGEYHPLPCGLDVACPETETDEETALTAEQKANRRDLAARARETAAMDAEDLTPLDEDDA